MPENGFMTASETRAEWEAAEKALLARRDKEQLAGELTAEEAALLASADAKAEAAAAAHVSASGAVAKAQDAVEAPWKGATLKEDERIADAERAQSRAARDEEDARLARTRLSVTISRARAARRAAVS